MSDQAAPDGRALVTVFVSSSPRPQDGVSEGDDNGDDGSGDDPGGGCVGALMVHQAVLSVWRALGGAVARTVLVFDGRHPRLPDHAWRAYCRKIALLRADPLLCGGEDGDADDRSGERTTTRRHVVFVEHSEWLHQVCRRALDWNRGSSSPPVLGLREAASCARSGPSARCFFSLSPSRPP